MSHIFFCSACFTRCREDLPQTRVPLQIVSPCAEPPGGESWLHEVQHDGHRLIAIAARGEPKLISHKLHDRTALFRLPFEKLDAAACRHGARRPDRHSR